MLSPAAFGGLGDAQKANTWLSCALTCGRASFARLHSSATPSLWAMLAFREGARHPGAPYLGALNGRLQWR